MESSFSLIILKVEVAVVQVQARPFLCWHWHPWYVLCLFTAHSCFSTISLLFLYHSSNISLPFLYWHGHMWYVLRLFITHSCFAEALPTFSPQGYPRHRRDCGIIVLIWLRCKGLVWKLGGQDMSWNYLEQDRTWTLGRLRHERLAWEFEDQMLGAVLGYF